MWKQHQGKKLLKIFKNMDGIPGSSDTRNCETVRRTIFGEKQHKVVLKR